MKDFPLARHAPEDFILGQPDDDGPDGPRSPRHENRKQALGRRLVALEASAGLHLGVLLLFMFWPQPAVPTVPEKTVLETIEVSLVETPLAAAVPDPGPKRPEPPKPVPRAPDDPRPVVQPARAAAPKPLPPKQAVRAAKPAPKPAQRDVTPPKAADLQALLNARMTQGREQAEQRLSHLQANARPGAAEAPEAGSGTPQGDPTVSASGLSGALASRTPLHQVNPPYPAEEERRGDEGLVIVKLFVRADGSVSRAEISRSSGRGSFDRAAVAAARQWRFSPLDDPAAPEQFGHLPFRFYLR